MTRVSTLLLLAIASVSPHAAAGDGQATDVITIRGKAQTLHLYGQRGNPPVIVSSGDGGWIHLAPHSATKPCSSTTRAPGS